MMSIRGNCGHPQPSWLFLRHLCETFASFFLPLPLQGQAARQQRGPGLNYDENIVQLLMKSGQNNPRFCCTTRRKVRRVSCAH